MGYSTDFTGEFKCTPPLSVEQVAYLKAFAESRRMHRNVYDLVEIPAGKKLREDAGLPLGLNGEYTVWPDGNYGQGTDSGGAAVSFNQPPPSQPTLWCQWTPSDNGEAIGWGGGEKFYEYTAWLQYLMNHFLKPWGVSLSGEVKWSGEDPDDRGKIVIEDTPQGQRAVERLGRVVYGQ